MAVLTNTDDHGDCLHSNFSQRRDLVNVSGALPETGWIMQNIRYGLA